MRRSLLLATLVFAACGSDIDKKSSTANQTTGPMNNGSSNNLVTNNTVANNTTVVPPNNTSPNLDPNNRDWSTCYVDEDGDGFGGEELMIDSLCAPAGYLDDGGDCDDSDPMTYPGGDLLCDGVDRACAGTWTPNVPAICPTIQAAIDAASATGIQGVIDVAPGTYFENIVFNGAAVTVVGAGPETTTIDGSNQNDAVVQFADGEGSDSGLEGFTITGGTGHLDEGERQGGGIWIDGADPTLRDLVIRGNRAAGGSDSGYGGGLSLSRSESLVERVDIVNNRAGYYGGGVHVSQSDATFRQVRILNNESLYGGGVAVYYSNASFVSVIIAANTGSYGGGALLQGDIPVFFHAQFVGNTAEEGGGILCTSGCLAAVANTNFSGNRAPIGGAIQNEDGSPVVDYSNFFDNGPEPVSNLSLSLFEGILNTEPGVVSTNGGAAVWDLHLRPTSALRDAGGLNGTDFDGSRADIGAYGGEFGDW